jgi:hypothetical protein
MQVVHEVLQVDLTGEGRSVCHSVDIDECGTAVARVARVMYSVDIL